MIVKYVFMLLGAAMLSGTYYLYQDQREFLAWAVSTEGTVVDLVTDNSSVYSPKVSFTSSDGRSIEFVSSYGSKPPRYSIGEKVEVLYVPDSPYSAEINSFHTLWAGLIFLFGFGAVFFLIGFGVALVPVLMKRAQRAKERLRKEGTPIDTALLGAEINRTIRINGRHPFQVVSQWQNPSTSQVHIFRSANLWYDPTDYLNTEQVRVFIDKNDPKRYLVDLSFLPEVVE